MFFLEHMYFKFIKKHKNETKQNKKISPKT